MHKNTIINKIIKIIFIYFQIWRVEMRNFVKKGICIFTPALLLSACGGGGSFNLDMVESAKPQPNQPKPEPKYQDEATKKRKTEDLNAMQEPGLGFAMQIKRRNNYPQNKEEHVPLLAKDIIKLKDEDKLNTLIKEVQDKKGEEIHSFDFSDGKSRATGYTDFKYVRLGYFFKNAFRELDSSNKIYKNGPFGYIFYKGINPSQSLPATGTAEYKGTWAYMTDAKNGQQFEPSARARYCSESIQCIVPQRRGSAI
ncbi:transferrin-binding N-lobe domain-containing protein [Kingella kingae]|uniref:transferrin-binding N-lobe domain-containing protein n=1 Tax=Kingella kingae TaxID=504 RepID=UPI002E36A3E9|nr:transferrin-binding N-lobe domain-containing protein [Kingella kingae]